MNYNAAERKDVRRAEKAAAERERLRHEVVFALMSHAGGREWMHDLLASCHVFSTTFTGDALTAAFAEGERNIGLRHLADVMQAAPDQYITMMREANERELAHEHEDRRSRDSEGADRGDRGSDPDDATGEDAGA